MSEAIPSIGLVLGGGGARGAYEAGVMRYISRHIRPCPGALAHFDIIVGTSAGAINGAWIAAEAMKPGHDAEGLAQLWLDLCIGDIYRLHWNDLARVPRGWLGFGSERRRRVALVDNSPLQEFVHTKIRMEGIREAVEAGVLRAFAVTATELATSRNIVFIQGRPTDERFWNSPNPYVRPRSVAMGPEHILASAAIPFVFEPVAVEGRYYVDGGLGQQTPLRPALRLGADKVMVISLRKTMKWDEAEQVAENRAAEPPTWAQIAGKTMNSVLLDKSNHEVERVERMNRMLLWGNKEFGADFAERFGEFFANERGAPVRDVPTLMISPTIDLGALAVEFVRNKKLGPTSWLVRQMIRTMSRAGSASENDMLSYLLFDPGYLAEVLRLGEEDARTRHDELAAFFSTDTC